MTRIRSGIAISAGSAWPAASSPLMPSARSLSANPLFLPRSAVRPDELQAASEDGLGVVVQSCDVKAVLALSHRQLLRRQRGPEAADACGPDYMIIGAVIDEHGLRDIPEPILCTAPESGQRCRRPHWHPVVAEFGDAFLLDVAGDALQRRHEQLKHRG